MQSLETATDLQKFSMQFPVLLVHQITSSDLENYCKHKQPFSFAWYGNPFTHNNQTYIRTLENITHTITPVPLSHQTSTNSDLNEYISQKKTINSIKNSELTMIPQWFQCCKCGKWRVNRIPKKDFPFTKESVNWSCDMIHLDCNVPQTHPGPPEYSQLGLHALQIQRNIRRKADTNFTTKWVKLAHAILDRLIRKYSDNTYLLPFLHPMYNPNNPNAMSIYKLKYLLETNSIGSFSAFSIQLFRMWQGFRAQYSESDPFHQRAYDLYQYCLIVIQAAKIPQQIKDSIIRQHTCQPTVQKISDINISNTNNNNNTSTPEIHIRPEQHLVIKEPLPPLENDNDTVINIMSDSMENEINNTNENDIILDNQQVNHVISDILINGNNETFMDVDEISNNNKEHVSNELATPENGNSPETRIENEKTNKSTEPLLNLPSLHSPEMDHKEDRMDVVEEEETRRSTRKRNKQVHYKQAKSSPLRYLKLRMATRPKNVKSVKKFEGVLVSTIIADKMKMIIKQMRVHDREAHFFKEVPHEDYKQIIKNPIHFGIIISKLNSNKYKTVGDILCDFNLLWSNCYLYNGKPNATDSQNFSNWASSMEEILNRYLEQLTQQLKIRGYISDNNGEYDEINRICHKLCLGSVSTNRIYTFSNRLEIYKEIESHFETYNVKQFEKFLMGKSSNYCRDMKNGTNTKGPIVPTKEMKRTIIERFEELKQCIASGTTLTRRIRKRRRKHRKKKQKRQKQKELMNKMDDDDSDSGMELSRRSSLSIQKRKRHNYMISDSDTENETVTTTTETVTVTDEINNIREMRSVLHPYAMRGPFTENNFTWCCDNKKCLYCPNGIYKKYSMPIWRSTKEGTFYLCDGCMFPKKYPIVKYIMDLDENRIRYGLDCSYPGCNQPLQCFYGMHNNCRGMKGHIRCNYCKGNISNVNVLYYHCIDGCLNYENINGHQIYVCEHCAGKYCNSIQRYVMNGNNNMLAFYGIWTCFDEIGKCEIIIMLQEANRISFRLCGKNEIYNGTMEEDKYIDDVNKIIVKMDDENGKYKHIIWKYKNDMDMRLQIFINKSNKIKVFHKVLPKCNNCKNDMLFLHRNIFPNNNKNNMKCCENLEQYNYMKYLTLKSINYAFFHECIYKNDFYFYCNQCNYGICQGCVLIKHEIEMNKRNIIQTKNKNNNNNNINLMSNDNNSNDLVQRLMDKIKVLENERDYWKQQSQISCKDRDYNEQKHKQLYNAMQSILDNEDNE